MAYRPVEYNPFEQQDPAGFGGFNSNAQLLSPQNPHMRNLGTVPLPGITNQDMAKMLNGGFGSNGPGNFADALSADPTMNTPAPVSFPSGNWAGKGYGSEGIVSMGSKMGVLGALYAALTGGFTGPGKGEIATRGFGAMVDPSQPAAGLGGGYGGPDFGGGVGSIGGYQGPDFGGASIGGYQGPDFGPEVSIGGYQGPAWG